MLGALALDGSSVSQAVSRRGRFTIAFRPVPRGQIAPVESSMSAARIPHTFHTNAARPTTATRDWGAYPNHVTAAHSEASPLDSDGGFRSADRISNLCHADRIISRRVARVDAATSLREPEVLHFLVVAKHLAR